MAPQKCTNHRRNDRYNRRNDRIPPRQPNRHAGFGLYKQVLTSIKKDGDTRKSETLLWITWNTQNFARGRRPAAQVAPKGPHPCKSSPPRGTSQSPRGASTPQNTLLRVFHPLGGTTCPPRASPSPQGLTQYRSTKRQCKNRSISGLLNAWSEFP